MIPLNFTCEPSRTKGRIKTERARTSGNGFSSDCCPKLKPLIAASAAVVAIRLRRRFMGAVYTQWVSKRSPGRSISLLDLIRHFLRKSLDGIRRVALSAQLDGNQGSTFA